MISTLQDHTMASGALRVSVACFRWNGSLIETIIDESGSLPSAAPHRDESLESTATRILKTIFIEDCSYMEQLYTFSYGTDANRETLVTYIAMFSSEIIGTSPWQDVNQLPVLSERDATVLEYAQTRLRAKLEYTGIAFHLLPLHFTLADLQCAYEAVLGQQLDKRNFRRRMATSGMLQETGEQRREGPHRPAALFRYSGRADRSSYLTPITTISQETSE